MPARLKEPRIKAQPKRILPSAAFTSTITNPRIFTTFHQRFRQLWACLKKGEALPDDFYRQSEATVPYDHLLEVQWIMHLRIDTAGDNVLRL